jgi:hypothetical protein
MNDRNPNIEHNPDTITEAERKAIEMKVQLVLSMAGDADKNPDVMLTVLSYALIHAAMNCQVTFASVIKVLADMYDSHPKNMETNDD